MCSSSYVMWHNVLFPVSGLSVHNITVKRINILLNIAERATGGVSDDADNPCRQMLASNRQRYRICVVPHVSGDI